MTENSRPFLSFTPRPHLRLDTDMCLPIEAVLYIFWKQLPGSPCPVCGAGGVCVGGDGGAARGAESHSHRGSQGTSPPEQVRHPLSPLSLFIICSSRVRFPLSRDTRGFHRPAEDMVCVDCPCLLAPRCIERSTVCVLPVLQCLWVAGPSLSPPHGDRFPVRPAIDPAPQVRPQLLHSDSAGPATPYSDNVPNTASWSPPLMQGCVNGVGAWVVQQGPRRGERAGPCGGGGGCGLLVSALPRHAARGRHTGPPSTATPCLSPSRSRIGPIFRKSKSFVINHRPSL